MTESFILLNKIKSLDLYTQKYIFSSFPKSDIALKIKLENNIYSLVENCIKGNVNVGNIRKKHQIDCLSTLYIIDYYIGIVWEKKYINEKRFRSFLNKLIEIKKIFYKWYSSETKK